MPGVLRERAAGGAGDLPVSAREAKEAALSYLGKADATEKKVRDKLRQKGFEGEAIEEAIGDLRRVGLIDDERYARSFAKRLAEKETVGARWIETKLVSRGVPYSMAGRIAEEFAADGSDDALRAARERLRRMGHVSDAEKLIRRLAGQLQRRGFDGGESFEAARAAVEERERGL